MPLCFLGAASVGLVACGGALLWVRAAAAVDPTADPVVGAVHFGMLATLSMGVLGALHQFTPVVTQRPLRSIALARATFLTWLLASWLLPLGFATVQEGVVEAGGGLAGVAVTLLVINLSAPLSVRRKGAPVAGLRLALAGFVATACFGLVYVADRRGNWFDLSGHLVLAHAAIGLFAWLGLTYVSVAEKLWPMFFLAHVPGRRLAGWTAISAIPSGVALGAAGLVAAVAPLAWVGAAILAVGLGAHLVSLAAHVRHRRRPPDLHLAFVVTSAAWLVAGAGLALAAAVVIPAHHHAGSALAAAAVGAFGGWLLEALVGHVHKVVPFILWSSLRTKGVATHASGRPLLFADLYDHRVAGLSYGLLSVGLVALCVGLAASQPLSTAVGGGLLMAVGVTVGLNLGVPPAVMARAPRAKLEAPPAPATLARSK